MRLAVVILRPVLRVAREFVVPPSTIRFGVKTARTRTRQFYELAALFIKKNVRISRSGH